MTEILTTKQVAEMLRLHETTVLKWAKVGVIPGICLGTHWRFSEQVLEEWMKKGGGNG